MRMLTKMAVCGGVLAMASAGRADVRAITVSGIVRMALPGNDVGQSVSTGLTVPVGAEVRTTENGRVTLQFGAGNTVRLKENSRLVVSEPKPKETRIQFLAGRMKGVFNRLTGGEKFSIQFSSGAVCSVKGTTIVIEETPDGYRVHTLYGVAELAKGNRSTMVPQGCGAGVGEGGVSGVSTLSDKQIEEGLANWETETDAGSGDEAAAREEQRQALRDVVTDMRAEVQDSQEQVTQKKDDDFATGRTMRDYHGNLARIEQRISRPEPDHIQFTNIVKRESYVYKGRFQYAGGNGARLDMLQTDIYLNVNMPENLVEWPQYAVDLDNAGVEAHPLKMVMTLANGGNGDTRRDVLQSTINSHQETVTRTDYTWQYQYDPGCMCNRSVQIPNTTTDTEWREVEVVTLNGRPITEDPFFSGEAYEVSGVDETTDTGELWGKTVGAVRYARLDAAGNPLRDANGDTLPDLTQPPLYLNVELYAINNDGKVLQVSDFASNGDQDPIALLKNIAGEAILCVTDRPGGGTDLLGRNGGPSNIDLIVTPDIIVNVVQKVAESGNIPSFGGDESSTGGSN